MGIRKSKNHRAKAAALSANGLTVRVGDHVSWRASVIKEILTGEVVAVTTREAKVLHDGRTARTDVLPFSQLTVDRQSRDDDKTAALVAVYKGLLERADAGDLSAYTFLQIEWPERVPADLRALLDLGRDAEKESTVAQ